MSSFFQHDQEMIRRELCAAVTKSTGLKKRLNEGYSTDDGKRPRIV